MSIPPRPNRSPNETAEPVLFCMGKVLFAIIAVAFAVLIAALVFAAFVL
jgi:hypothetical protein